MTDDVCGYERPNGKPCQNPPTEGDHCWIASHGGDVDGHGRPSKLNDDTQEAIYAAVGSGLKLRHVANAAGVSPDSIRRWTCCIDDLRECTLNTADPCDFCEGYAQAHANGAMEVLDECRPEFRASASFGYTESQEIEHTGDGLDLSLTDEEREMLDEALDVDPQPDVDAED